MSGNVRCNSAIVPFVVAISVTLCLDAVADEFGRTASVPAADDLPISVAAPLPDQPAWLLGQFQIGGEFLTNSPCHALRSSDPEECRSSVWYVPAETPEGEGSLFVVLDRSLLTNDLTLELTLEDTQGSSLYVDLLATNMATVGTNLCGNLIAGSNEIVCLELPLPLTSYPLASIIRLWRGVGTILVYESRLYPTNPTASDEERRTADDADPRGYETCLFPGRANNLSGLTVKTPRASSVRDSGSPDRIGSYRMIHVNAKTGDDTCDGRTLARCGTRGPKRTIPAALSIAEDGDAITVAPGTYDGNVSFCGKNVDVFMTGDVTLQ